VVLLVAAIQVKNSKTCSDVQIDIDNHGERIFVNEKDIDEVLKANNVAKGVAVEDINLGVVENILENNAWIKDAELFFDNNQVLTVKIAERQPMARIFTTTGASFYIDTAGKKLPLSEKFSARVPVFTSFTADKKVMTGADSVLVEDVKHIAQFIQQDSFWSAQVAQVDITPQHTYEIIPVLGNQVIKLGNADNLERKFKRLFAFYKQVWSKAGFEKYETIDVQFEGQVVAVRRGEAVPVADSAAAVQQYATGVANLRGVVRDSLYASVEKRDEEAAKDSVASRHRTAATKKSANGQVAGKKKTTPKQPAKNGKAKKKTVLPAKHH
jgi:cell division protein FtsQ